MSTLRIAIVGLGTVGQGVVELLRRNADQYASRCGRGLQVAAALVRDSFLPREFSPRGAVITSDPEAFWRVPSDLIVEVAGGVDPARAVVTRALESGRDVVTANKALLAIHAPSLFELAERKRRRLFFEASVAGGVPVIQLVTQALSANTITAFAGILNGTCNFILTQMARGGSYESALKDAQRLGFAEADPTLDVSGRDSVEKLSILASLAFGCAIPPDKILYDGITRVTTDDLKSAAAIGASIKLIASARRTDHGIELWSGPTLLPNDSPLAKVSGAEMALLAKADAVSHMFISGDGAGRFPTASAVVSDILDCARLFDSRPAGRLNPWPIGAPPARIAPMMDTIDQGRSGALIRPLKC